MKNLKQSKKIIVRFWETPIELRPTVSRSMVSLIKNIPAEGWVISENVDEKA